MQKTVFTLCSNNYLAQAKTLGDSLKKFNSDIHFVIGLVDKLHPNIDYKSFDPFEILPYDVLGVKAFDSMLKKYNVIEFNTAVKPFYFEFLMKRHTANDQLFYLDPDIACYTRFDEMDKLLREHDFLITPHLCQPFNAISPFELSILRCGTYNLGFIGVRHSQAATEFMRWWQARVTEHCLIDYPLGLFVDQKWINFMPDMFPGTYVIKAPGYNMACWNFHERKLQHDGNGYTVNGEHPLVFFHFSGFKPSDMNFISKIKIPELSLEQRPDLKQIFHEYAQAINDNGYAKYSKLNLLLNFGEAKFTTRQRIGRSLKFRTNKWIKNVFNI